MQLQYIHILLVGRGKRYCRSDSGSLPECQLEHRLRNSSALIVGPYHRHIAPVRVALCFSDPEHLVVESRDLFAHLSNVFSVTSLYATVVK